MRIRGFRPSSYLLTSHNIRRMNAKRYLRPGVNNDFARIAACCWLPFVLIFQVTVFFTKST